MSSSKTNIKKTMLREKKDYTDVISKGRTEITTRDELIQFPPGSLVSYMKKNGLFRSGGFLIAIHDNFFTLRGGKVGKPVTFDVFFNDVDKIYVGDFDLTPTTKKPTKFPVFIGDTIVYYGKDKYDAKRYTTTNKFIRTLQWYNQFRENDLQKKNNIQNTLKDIIVHKLNVFNNPDPEQQLPTLSVDEIKQLKILLQLLNRSNFFLDNNPVIN